MLITKGKKEYNNVLAVINTSDPLNMLNYVRGFSQRCYVKMMAIDEESLVYKGHLVESHSKIDTELIRGNPIIEVVKEAKKGYDFIVAFAVVIGMGIFLAFIAAYFIGRYMIWYFPDFLSRWFTVKHQIGHSSYDL